MATRRSVRPRGGRPYRRLWAQVKREEGVCHLCGLAIDPGLRSPHPLSFTLDHIVPVSMGGVLVSRDNVRAAHRRCNMQRGTGRGSPRTQGDRSAGW